MIIATRILEQRRGQTKQDVPVRLHAPEKTKDVWICRFEIDWSEGKVERWGTGSDAIQALLFALNMIGAQLYASDANKSGELVWLKEGNGFGFPVSNNIRDLLVGDDKRFL